MSSRFRHVVACVRFPSFLRLNNIPLHGMYMPHDSMFNCLRKRHAIFHKGHTILLSHWQCTEVPVSPCSCHHGRVLISRSWLCPQRRGQCPARSSVQFSRSVVSDSLRPHGLQHARLPCLSPTPRAYSNSCPSSRWSHPTISSSVIPFSSCLQSFPASGFFFQWSQFFASGSQSIGASASVLAMNIQDWFPLGLTAVQGTLKSLLQHHSSKASILRRSA